MEANWSYIQTFFASGDVPSCETFFFQKHKLWETPLEW